MRSRGGKVNIILVGNVVPVFVSDEPVPFPRFVFDVSDAIFAHVPPETRARAIGTSVKYAPGDHVSPSNSIRNENIIYFCAQSTTGRDGCNSRLRRSTAFYGSSTPFAVFGFQISPVQRGGRLWYPRNGFMKKANIGAYVA